MTNASARAVDVRDITHRYDTDDVLRGVSLSIAAGESLALLGPSGCGKTTLLRVLAGLERPSSGSVSVADVTMVDDQVWVPPERRHVGMIFQDWALFPHLSVAANVGYGLPRAERSGPSVDDALGLVGLAGLGDRMPATLSGGQQQRVALARALAPRPGVLLLDEPFSNLDTTLRVEVRGEVHRLLVDLGITAVFVTHDQEEAFVVGDRVAVMREGRVVQVDRAQALYRDPVDRWTAEFVGTASIITGEAVGGAVRSPFGPVPVPVDLGGPVDVVLRPEQLALAAGDAATVEDVEFYGHDAMVHLDADGTSLKVRTDADPGVTRGARVGITFVGDTARAFPAR